MRLSALLRARPGEGRDDEVPERIKKAVILRVRSDRLEGRTECVGL
jgi:hypothetical protein